MNNTMNQKLKLVSMLVCALFFVTGCNSDKFTIDGYISGMADQDVYLYVDPHGGDLPQLPAQDRLRAGGRSACTSTIRG